MGVSRHGSPGRFLGYWEIRHRLAFRSRFKRRDFMLHCVCFLPRLWSTSLLYEVLQDFHDFRMVLSLIFSNTLAFTK